MVCISVYYHLWENGESIVLKSREFGWMEYFDDYDTFYPLVFKSKKDLICNTYNAKTGHAKIKMFNEGSSFIYLGEL